MNRRRLLQACPHPRSAAPAARCAPLPRRRRLSPPRRHGRGCCVVFLRGAYDAANLLVPRRQRLLLREPAEHRHRAARPRRRRGHRARRRLGAAPGAARSRCCRCTSAASWRSCRSPAPTTHRAAISRRRTRSSSARRDERGSRNYQSGFMNRLARRLGGRDARSPSPTSCRWSSAAQCRCPTWRWAAWASPAHRRAPVAAHRGDVPRTRALARPRCSEGFAVRDEVVQRDGRRDGGRQPRRDHRQRLRARRRGASRG